MSNNTEHGGRRINAGRMCATFARMAIAVPGASAIALPGAGAAVLIAAMAVSPAHGQCKYEITRLADQGCPFGSVELVYGLNESGIVVGEAWQCSGDHDFAVYWDDPDEMTKLSIPGDIWEAAARDINNEKVIVGEASDQYGGGGREAFRFDGSFYKMLGTLHDEPGSYSIATAINENGTIIGYAGNGWTGEPPTQSVIWQDGEATGLLEDFGMRNRAHDVDDQGRIVGEMGQGPHIDSHAFIWENGVVTDLGVIPGGYSALASGINNRRQVVGHGRKEEPGSGKRGFFDQRAFLWEGEGLIDLGALPGFTDMRAFAINDMEQIVGDCPVGAISRAFLWQHGVMMDLNELVDLDPDEQLGQAYDINNRGQIAGKTAGTNSGFLLTPMNRPTGDADCDCTVGGKDLDFLLSEWGRTDSPADLDGDGIVDVTDLLMVLGDWGVSTAVDTADK